MPDFKIIQAKMTKFLTDRKWVNTPQDVAKSIIIEGAELLEHFQWDGGSSKTWQQKLKEKNLEDISMEAADIFLYLIQLCQLLNIDLLEAADRKLDKQAIKYPVDKMLSKDAKEFYKEQKRKYRNN